MKVYETTFIINPQMEDATIDNKVNVVSEIISNNSGKILHADHMGTRKLAYQIKGLTQGYYASFIFESNTDVLKILDRHLKLDETYLRHLTIVYEGDMLEKKQREKEQAQKEQAQKEAESENTDVKETDTKPVKTEEPEIKTEVKAETETKIDSEPVAEKPAAEEVKADTEVKKEVEPKSSTDNESLYNEEDEL
ncbi:MAG: 30S ribosomal protein S6 [candidate division Zixibacteria bacterium]|nr:30S ribosomal protein S6 [candidate division Zixibacteria bacterium]